jgi:hypothetical protein
LATQVKEIQLAHPDCDVDVWAQDSIGWAAASMGLEVDAPSETVHTDTKTV